MDGDSIEGYTYLMIELFVLVQIMICIRSNFGGSTPESFFAGCRHAAVTSPTFVKTCCLHSCTYDFIRAFCCSYGIIASPHRKVHLSPKDLYEIES
uniref:SMB domain-containing protein n=1 Tax=Heterorhabditis bacteriophora TaxID=37862 RepID=A0A1I7XLX2_HETBA